MPVTAARRSIVGMSESRVVTVRGLMGPALRGIAGYLPLTRVTDAVRDPWLGTGTATGSLVAVAVLAVVAAALAVRRSAL